PVAASLDHDPGKPLKVWVVNDRMQALKDTLKIEVLTFSGEKLYSKELPFEISGNETTLLAVFEEGDLLNGVLAEEVMVLLSSLNDRFQKNYYYLRDYKDIQLPKANLTVERNTKDQTITVQTDVLARFICLDMAQSEVTCSDNFFDLLPGETKTVRLNHLGGEKIHLQDIQVSAINNLKD
ncbi:glycoside hydrolase family 2 protein, partial [Bacillus haikouensis]|uniref:glycoside hydrolase family 2 protein n=1 Tax=Bacillus haikouensis TaxID=1510468 RepID=UPI0028AA1F7A